MMNLTWLYFCPRKSFRVEHTAKEIGINPIVPQHCTVSSTLNILHKYLKIIKMYLNFNIFMEKWDSEAHKRPKYCISQHGNHNDKN